MQEDRIRIAGATEDGRNVVIWLTRRLLGLLLPVLSRHLEGQFNSASPEHREALQEFAQQAARESIGGAEPVKARPDDESLVAISVDVAHMEDGVLLTFRSGEEGGYRLPLTGAALRQWMHILYQSDLNANWQLPQWPAWLTGENAAEFDVNAALH